MSVVAIVVGMVLVVSVTADMVNTLVTTTTSMRRWWLSVLLYRRTWTFLRAVGAVIPRDSVREALYSTFAPVSVLLLLVVWVAQQVIGFGLIWWGIGGVDGADGLFDSIYYSGVVYFTLGFGEVVPTSVVPRVGALVEAMSGVLTTALVIGYLPALYSAYSERERKLMTIDDGTEGRITPTNLILSRAPTADVDDLLRFFDGWEEWVAGVMETHTAFPMLRLFRSKYAGQNWITAMGLLADASLQCQMIKGCADRTPYWLLRQIIVLFDELTRGEDLTGYRQRLDELYAGQDDGSSQALFAQLYDTLKRHGFELVDVDTARQATRELRVKYDAQLEFLIDSTATPRGFWGHRVGHRVGWLDGLAEPAE